MQVSHSKKWQSRSVLDEFGEPMRTKTGKIVLKKSYSILQDQYHDAMFAAGYTDVERGERGSTEEHLKMHCELPRRRRGAAHEHHLWRLLPCGGAGEADGQRPNALAVKGIA